MYSVFLIMGFSIALFTLFSFCISNEVILGFHPKMAHHLLTTFHFFLTYVHLSRNLFKWHQVDGQHLLFVLMHGICDASQRRHPHGCHLRWSGAELVNGPQLRVDQLKGVHLLWIVHQLNRPAIQKAHFAWLALKVVPWRSAKWKWHDQWYGPRVEMQSAQLTLWMISVRNRAMNWNTIATSIVAMTQRLACAHLWVQSFVGHIPPSLCRLS